MRRFSAWVAHASCPGPAGVHAPRVPARTGRPCLGGNHWICSPQKNPTSECVQARYGSPDWLEFDSTINLRPPVNRSRSIQDPATQALVIDVVRALVR